MKFAITMSTYQRSDGKTPFYLKRALDSIFSQTHQLFKIYIIGDKYDDDDEFISIVKEYPSDKLYYENLSYAAERDKYSNNKQALWCAGGANALNYALNLALKDDFQYICHLDHDDYWNPNHLESLNEVIEETNADWLCTLSVHINNSVRPEIKTSNKYIEYLPSPSKLINSSTCINFITLPIRCRDVFAETGKTYPADADRWIRCSKYIQENNLKSYFVNSLTCVHDEEGFINK